MIRKVHFQNFRCLRDVELTLEPLTVLVGPNSSGKTTVLEGLSPRFYQRSDLWRHDEKQRIFIVWSYEDDSINEALFDPADPSRLEPSRSKVTKRGQAQTPRLRASLHEVQSLLLDTAPMFSDVDLQPIAEGRHRLRFQDRWHPELWLAPNEVSDGTMLLLAFIVLQHQTPAPDLITIEEPERALHPYLLDELIQMLRKLSTGEIGKKPVQVVLATHSAELLEYVRPEEVRFLTRSREDGSVQVNQAATDTPNWRRVYEEYNRSLGGIWLSGGMGGVPGA